MRRGVEDSTPVRRDDGSQAEVDRSGELPGLFRQRGFDALVMVGGDSSMEIAEYPSRKRLRVVGVPMTIDNDLDRSSQTFGIVRTARDRDLPWRAAIYLRKAELACSPWLLLCAKVINFPRKQAGVDILAFLPAPPAPACSG